MNSYQQKIINKVFTFKKIIIISYFCLIITETAVDVSAAITPLGRIRTNGKWFVDEDNRVVLFRGFNSVRKEFPWVPDPTSPQLPDGCLNLKNTSQLQNLKDWGFNVARLGFMWSGLYPQKGVLNQTYVDEMMGIVKRLEEYGIYVILDLHQDMMSSKFQSYDGAPIWAVNELPAPKHSFPWPFRNITSSFEAYITEAGSQAFQCLYNNISSFEQYFHEFWTTTATIFKDTPSVLAYELINEPWVGN
jgi:endoglycosylceramidase